MTIWHPNSSWRVQFDRRNYEHNFFVKCDCYFRTSLYGFSRAKNLAIAYRQRLEAEWDEICQTWHNIDINTQSLLIKKSRPASTVVTLTRICAIQRYVSSCVLTNKKY
ncbi:AP2 domain transcription factor AP2IV-1 [Cardiosporidium cionae]|uniref:AP2 domain transcription factor AP2IV-1 n=1 Tax=Cardiosporidium cionae TaxID=476202 RepID=A0ABQ7J491_9APIC|nr:AP2 domain transcription factor AP2IV-1 [Cardiosporidium cionae]|eukprot:KAF8817932.1 AP2 domain transcription factor AP2IV-1 [Cardiosporidium cionae]